MGINAAEEYINHRKALSKRLQSLATRPPKTLFKDIFHRLRFKDYSELDENIISLSANSDTPQKKLNFENQDIQIDN
ncbi:unnamed protein product [Blepharisma stoltei]|uniref:Uncharacterized protein n=1 Tax=Blepharisma stoltei TaxID=1481888 RepID=A0AAU9IGQ2_9CILI|nr:unnamed protein product [Blepharisma stoltei]